MTDLMLAHQCKKIREGIERKLKEDNKKMPVIEKVKRTRKIPSGIIPESVKKPAEKTAPTGAKKKPAKKKKTAKKK